MDEKNSDNDYQYTVSEIVANYKKRRDNATEEEKEHFELIEAYSANQTKYIVQGIYFESLDKSYLKNQTYQERLEAAKRLNGCGFKSKKNSKETFASREKKHPVSEFMSCDGRYIFLRLAFCAGFRFFFLGLLAFPFSPAVIFFLEIDLSIKLIYLAGVMGPFQYFLYCVWRKIDYADYVLFDRFTGLVRIPRRLWRKPIYVPIDDVELVEGPVVRGARGGGKVPTGSLVLTKYPHTRWFQPGYALLGGMDQRNWADIIRFMDSSKCIDNCMYKAIEPYFAKGKTVLGTPYHKELRKYFDATDKQVNRREFW